MGLGDQRLPAEVGQQVRVAGGPFVDQLRKVAEQFGREEGTRDRSIGPTDVHGQVQHVFIWAGLVPCPVHAFPDVNACTGDTMP